MKTEFRSRLFVSTLLASVAFVASPAFAADKDAPPAQAPATPAATDASAGPDIVVTGTLIQNPNLTSASPVHVTDAGEILKRAPATAEELLRGIPGVSPGLGTQVNNGSNGINEVDLRGLGVQRNIVLLDGNRIVPSLSNGVVDLNEIPLALIERVDVLTGGASTTYGADAVSGVVNFITKRNFTGLQIDLGEKVLEGGGGNSFRGSVTVGANFADDRGNAVLNFSYTKINPVYQIAPFAIFGVSSTSGKASGSSATAVPTSFAFNTGSNVQIDPTSTSLVAPYAGYNFNPFNLFQTPLDRKSVYAATHYQVADNIEFYARGMYDQSTIQFIAAASGVFGSALTVPANNPYLPASIRDQICIRDSADTAAASAASVAKGAPAIPDATTVGTPLCTANAALPLPGVYRRSVELGPRITTYDNSDYDARAGLKIDISKSINADLSASYGRAQQIQTNSGYIITPLLQQALNATNTTTCTVTTGGCVPLNLFGQVGSITPAQAAFVGGQSTIRINTELYQARAVVQGDVGKPILSATNPVSFAVGAEYRKYTYQRSPDAYAATAGVLGGAGGAMLPFTGGYNVAEAFGEVIAPLVNDQPLAKEISLEGGLRYSSYHTTSNTAFDAVTWKGGANWAPVESLKFRGTYQHAVRAPNINELFAPVVTGLTNLAADPCAGAAPTLNPLLAAVCFAQGAKSIGSIPNPSAGQANETGGGNPNIKPESANTWTIGAVFNGHGMVPGLTASIDYYNIDISNAITFATPGDAIAACFGTITAASATSAACTSIRRSPSNGALSGDPATTFGLPLPLTNNGRLKTDGIDLRVDYAHKFGDYGLNLSFDGNWTDHLHFQASPTSDNRDCVGYYSANCGPGLGQLTPAFTWNQRTTLSAWGISASLLWRHLSGMQYEGQAPDFLARGFTTANNTLFSGVITNTAPAVSELAGTTQNFNKIPAYDYFDLTLQFEVDKKFTFTIGMQNMFNKLPPVVGTTAGSTTANGGNTFPSTYDPLGRSFNASVKVHF